MQIALACIIEFLHGPALYKAGNNIERILPYIQRRIEHIDK